MSSESFTIPYPKSAAGKKRWAKQYGFNAFWKGKTHKQKVEDAQYWKGLVAAEMNRQQVRKRPFDKPVTITFWWNDGLDCTNHAAMGKMIEDAMKCRLIKDDSRRFVRGVSHFFHDESYILVQLDELPDKQRSDNIDL